MGPIRGLKKKKKPEKKADYYGLVSSLNQPETQNQPLDWWVDFSKRINGSLAVSESSKKFESVFKISRKTFNYICSLVGDDLTARNINLTSANGKTLSLNDQVAIALRRLSSGESLLNVGDLFGVSQSTVSHVTWRFVETLEKRGINHLCWPSNEAEITAIKSKFEKIHGLPNCCGVIDATRIVMTLPAVDHSNDVWIDREKNHSMVLQAIVDPDMRFRDVNVGYPGSLSDALVLHNSSFFKLSEEGKRLNGNKMELPGGKELGEYIIGDAGFPLMPWLLTPYQHAQQEHQVKFNKRHSAATLVAQIALARLKEMWRIIHGIMWLPDKNRLPRIIFVCCLLHNIVIDMADKMLDELPMSHNHDKDYRQQICTSATDTGTEMREKLSLYLFGNRICRDAELVKSQGMPFQKKSFAWEDIESMEVFRFLPQKPHFSPLIELEEADREGLAMRHMMTFAMLVEKTSKLRVDDPRIDFQSYLEVLANLELHGFVVKAVADRLNMLLSMKDKYEQLKDQLTNEQSQPSAECDYCSTYSEEDTGRTDKTMNESGEKQAIKAANYADILIIKRQFVSVAGAPW